MERDTVAATLEFRGFPSLAAGRWRMVQDVNEASVYVPAERDG
jgi:hypothetical protein